MSIIIGSGVGLVLGLIGAWGFTLYGIAQSNIVGEGEGNAFDFMNENDSVQLHEQRDEKVIVGVTGAKRVDVNTYRGGKYRY